MPKEKDIGLAARDVTGWRYATRPPARFKGHEELVVGGSPEGLADIPEDVDSVRLQVDSNDLRWLGDGSDPTATVGERLKTTDAPLVLENVGREALFTLRFISLGGGSNLHVQYFKVRA